VAPGVGPEFKSQYHKKKKKAKTKINKKGKCLGLMLPHPHLVSLSGVYIKCRS
jgi:hypothetical protein